MIYARGCRFMLHSFKTLRVFCGPHAGGFFVKQKTSANEERRKLMQRSALNQKPPCIELLNASFTFHKGVPFFLRRNQALENLQGLSKSHSCFSLGLKFKSMIVLFLIPFFPQFSHLRFLP